jgi:hypothetical protein
LTVLRPTELPERGAPAGGSHDQRVATIAPLVIALGRATWSTIGLSPINHVAAHFAASFFCRAQRVDVRVMLSSRYMQLRVSAVHRVAMQVAQHFTDLKFSSRFHGVGTQLFLNCRAQFSLPRCSNRRASKTLLFLLT